MEADTPPTAQEPSTAPSDQDRLRARSLRGLIITTVTPLIQHVPRRAGHNTQILAITLSPSWFRIILGDGHRHTQPVWQMADLQYLENMRMNSSGYSPSFPSQKKLPFVEQVLRARPHALLPYISSRSPGSCP